MEAIGEHLAGSVGDADDAGTWLPRTARLHAVPAVGSSQPGPQFLEPGPVEHDLLGGLASQLGAVALTAPDVLAAATHAEAADFAGRIEELSRTVEYLQLLSAGAVDRTRARAITDAAAAGTKAGRRRGRSTGWDANGVETLNETDASWPAGPSKALPSPADDGCPNTAAFLRLRLRIPIREARRRLTLAHHILPGTTLTGQPTPPTRPHIAAALTPATEPHTPHDAPQSTVTAPVLSSHAATLITATLDRLHHHTTPDTLDRIEHHLTTAAATTDPDFLTRLAQRWTDTIDPTAPNPPKKPSTTPKAPSSANPATACTTSKSSPPPTNTNTSSPS